MIFIYPILFLILGLLIGSFLNVVIYRYNTHKSLGGRSGCMVCQKKLSWHELIPLFSFLFLKGRCKKCKTKISIQYPLVELLTGLIFLGIFLKFKDMFFLDTFIFSITFLYYAFVFSLILVISVYDLKHKIIPDKLAFALGAVSFIGLFFFSGSFFNPHVPSVWEFLSGVVVSLPFALIWFISRGKWMGLGDAKLLIGLGWLVGLKAIISGVILSFWTGAFVGILLMSLSKRYSIKSEIPFAPFLAFGAIISFIFEIRLFEFWF